MAIFFFKAYRREKQKAENGQTDPAETSWRLIKALRDRLQAKQVQKIMKTAGVVGQTANLGLLDAGEIKEMVSSNLDL